MNSRQSTTRQHGSSAETPMGGTSVAAVGVRAREDRAAASQSLGSRLKAQIVSLWRNGIARPFARWAAHERAVRELSMLDDRELADLGITRGQIPYVAAAKLTITDRGEQPIHRTANENRRTRHAA